MEYTTRFESGLNPSDTVIFDCCVELIPSEHLEKFCGYKFEAIIPILEEGQQITLYTDWVSFTSAYY